jgi:hypothetical protein
MAPKLVAAKRARMARMRESAVIVTGTLTAKAGQKQRIRLEKERAASSGADDLAEEAARFCFVEPRRRDYWLTQMIRAIQRSSSVP